MMRRKVLVHPALGRAVAELEAEMHEAMQSAFDNWMAEVDELRRELAILKGAIRAKEKAEAELADLHHQRDLVKAIAERPGRTLQ